MISLFLISLLPCIINAYTVFPAGKCPPQDCLVYNPYILTPNASTDKLCFTVYQQTCDPNNRCCNSLKNVFEKIAFKTYPECFRSVKQVTVDGVKKGGGVYITNYTGFTELKVTAIRWTIADALYKTFCVHLQPPCESLTKFCRGDSCTYSVYDPFTHECCPTCNFIFPNTTSPNLTPPASPSPYPAPPSPNPMYPMPPSPNPVSPAPPVSPSPNPVSPASPMSPAPNPMSPASPMPPSPNPVPPSPNPMSPTFTYMPPSYSSENESPLTK